MRPSDDAPALTLEWRIGGAAVALFAVFIGWAPLRPRPAPAPPAPDAAAVRGAPMRSAVAPPAAAPPLESPDEKPAARTPAPVAPPPAAVAPVPQPAEPAPAAPVPAPDLPKAGPSAPTPPAHPAPPPAVARTEAPTTVTIQSLANFEASDFRRYDDGSGNSTAAAPAADPVPKEVRALSGRRVSIDGYMLPFDFADGSCNRFVLTNLPPGCCYGCSMRPNNWIDVTMAKSKAAKCSDASQTVRVVGVLVVHGLNHDESPLYTMTGESAEDVK